ncbi:hypothetical protein VHEMI01033 [[Torrubiella] hemipterigena]|nr:hypothetical protein VHEMI01033 [[Torrubiella] hemipterigena]
MKLLALVVSLIGLAQTQDTGVHPEWPRWCGKVYKPEYPSFNPGGQTVEPARLADGPALHIQFKPRYSVYIESENEAEFIVNAAVSEWFGSKWPGLANPATAPPVVFTVNMVSNNNVLVSNHVQPGTTGNLFKFNLTSVQPSLEPYQVVLFGAPEAGSPNITVSSEFFYLPEKKSGSVTKIDNLHGGMLFRNSATKGQFQPILPYGFYAQCVGLFCEDDYQARIKAYSDLGLNGMVPLTPITRNPAAFAYMNTLPDMHYMYDLRDYFRNLSLVESQVTAVKDHENIYSYWGTDEPDGWQYPFNTTIAVTDLIHKLDPYHPVAVTLNCQNYYFGPYTRGFDFIMEDAYPIAINSTFSKWGTACNATYGDCGCDNCHGNVQDVPSRLDDLIQYEKWLGLWPKTKVHNPQSFHGEDYWFRDPTPAEEVVMNALAFNHHAKSIISWVWPTSDALAQIHGKYAKVVAQVPVRDFIVLSEAQPLPTKCNKVVDAAYWKYENQVLLNVVNGGYEPINRTVRVPLPDSIKPSSIKSVEWGNGTWALKDGTLRLGSIDAMSANMIILDL